MATVSHIMVPNPTKSIIAETQSRVSDIITEMQRNLSKLLVSPSAMIECHRLFAKLMVCFTEQWFPFLNKVPLYLIL